DPRPDRRGGLGWCERRVLPRDPQIRLGEDHFHVGEHRPEEGPPGGHLLDDLPSSPPAGEALERRTHAVPAGEDGTVLGPGEYPRNGTQGLEPAGSPLRRAGTDGKLPDLLERGRRSEGIARRSRSSEARSSGVGARWWADWESSRPRRRTSASRSIRPRLR